jgi:hypothetical protein
MNTQASRARRTKRLAQPPIRGRTGKKHVSAGPANLTPGGFPTERLPDPWLIDSEYLLNELARIRELALRVPLSNATFLPTNSVVDAIWELEQLVRYVLSLHREAQRAFALKGQKNISRPAPKKPGARQLAAS